VIVTFSGWLYIILGLLGMTQLRTMYSGGERLYMLLSLAIVLAMAVGLLLRRNWARWLMLGMAFLTWTLGSLGILWAIATLLKMSFGSMRVPVLGYVGSLVVMAAFGAYIWLHIRLFLRLTSDEGRAEFRTPPTERYAVVKSTAFHIALSLIGVFISGAGPSRSNAPFRPEVAMNDRAPAVIPERTGDSEAEASRLPEPIAPPDGTELTIREYETRMAAEAADRRARLEAAQARQSVANDARAEARAEHDRKLKQLQQRLRTDRTYTSTQFEADSQRLWDELMRSEREAIGARPASAGGAATARPSDTNTDDDSGRSSSGILKCRDAAGAVSYTQGYCPAGTTLVQ